MKRKIISVPCIVNSWLYACGWKIWKPGLASSVLISNAKIPPMMKNANELIR